MQPMGEIIAELFNILSSICLFAVGGLAIVSQAVDILERMCNHFCQGVLKHTNSNKWREILMNQDKSNTQKSANSTAASGKTDKGFTDEEKAAMKERAKELKAEARAQKDRAAGESALLEKIAEMPEPDRFMAEQLHEIIKASAPDLMPKTWYGMPAYARDGKVVCFFQAATKFNTRYATLGFNDTANLDEGAMWPTAFALKELTATVEKKVSSLVKKAVS
jgi:uncharacterized protein YdhG (YjbR/CyaY superfamily)